MVNLVPEGVVKGSRFTFWGSGGWPMLTRVRVTLLLASASVCKRPQPSATLCNRLSAAVVGSKLPCLREKSQKRDFFDVSEDVVMSFCVAGVALRGIPSCFKTRQKSFFVAGAAPLDTSDFILCGRRSTLDVSCCMFSANRIVSVARSGDKVQIPWQVWHLVTCHEDRRKPRTKRRFCRFHTLHSTLSTLYTPHFTLHTLHPTHYFHTLHSTLYIPHFTRHTLHSTLYY